MSEKQIVIQVGVSEESVEEVTDWCSEMQATLDILREVSDRAPRIQIHQE